MTIAGEWSVCCYCIYIIPNCVSVLNFFCGSRSDFSFRSIHPKRWNSRPTGSHDDESISKANKLGTAIGCCCSAAAGTVIHSNSSQQLVAMGTARENQVGKRKKQHFRVKLSKGDIPSGAAAEPSKVVCRFSFLFQIGFIQIWL